MDDAQRVAAEIALSVLAKLTKVARLDAVVPHTFLFIAFVVLATAAGADGACGGVVESGGRDIRPRGRGHRPDVLDRPRWLTDAIAYEFWSGTERPRPGQPVRRTRATSAVTSTRVFTPSLANTLRSRPSTVCRDMPRRAATC